VHPYNINNDDHNSILSSFATISLIDSFVPAMMSNLAHAGRHHLTLHDRRAIIA
jgi:hypothetical protein